MTKQIRTLFLLFAAMLIMQGCKNYYEKTYTFESQSIDLDGVMNARDLGGYVTSDGRKVKPGLLLRGSCLARATDEDLSKLHDKYHVVKDFDFRLEAEANRAPDRLFDSCEYIFLPVIDKNDNLLATAVPPEYHSSITEYLTDHADDPAILQLVSDMYSNMVFNEWSQKQYASFLREVVDTPEGGVFFHCSYGKDRTGWASVFLLSALGADRKMVIRDFEISNEPFQNEVMGLINAMMAKGLERKCFEVARIAVGVSVKNFEKTLRLIDDKYGSMDNFLKEALLLTDEDIQLLRDRYLE